MAVKWRPPDGNWIKLNVDATYEDFEAGWAVVARDAQTNFVGCGTGFQNVLSPLEAETKSVLLAAEFAVLVGWQRVIIESDAEKVINMLVNEQV